MNIENKMNIEKKKKKKKMTDVQKISVDDAKSLLKGYMEYKKKLQDNVPKPTKLFISTISAKAKIVYVGHEDEPLELIDIVRCLWKKRKINEKVLQSFQYKTYVHNCKESKQFNNCCTLNFSDVNMRLFSKGNMTLVGLKYEEQGNKVLKELTDFINEENSERQLKHKIKIIGYKKTMINSNFECNFKLDRAKLYDLLKNRIKVSYGVTKYPGVKIYYMYNINNERSDYTKMGYCMCKDKVACDKKKKNCSGLKENECKKIMIAVFQTGSIIISGASTNEQLLEAYNWINYILTTNYKDIVKISIDDYKKTL